MTTQVDRFIVAKCKRKFELKRGEGFTLVHSGSDHPKRWNVILPTLDQRNCVNFPSAGIRGMGWCHDIVRSGFRDENGTWNGILWSSLN